jgi:hypothetical protein
MPVEPSLLDKREGNRFGLQICNRDLTVLLRSGAPEVP